MTMMKAAGKTTCNPAFMGILKQFRVAKGLTCAELAARLKVTTTTVSNWETGKTLPWPRTYPKLARMLGLTPLQLARIIEPSEDVPPEFRAEALVVK